MARREKHLGASLRDRAGGLKPQAAVRLGLSALIPCALAACSNSNTYQQVECINIATGEKLTDTDSVRPAAARFGFYGIDGDGYTRFVPEKDASGWKCRYTMKGNYILDSRISHRVDIYS